MWNRLRQLFRLPQKGQSDERVLELERELQGLRLELEEREQRTSRLDQSLERQRSAAEVRVGEAVVARQKEILADVASPIAQLLTQAHLLEVEGRPVSARDILAVAKRLIRILEDHGLSLEGRVGETVPFDPNHHDPLSGASSLRPGQVVRLCFVGVAYRGKLLLRAGVERAGE